MPKVRKPAGVYSDSETYLAKKSAFAKLTTVYGKYTVMEALLRHPQPRIVRLLLAEDLEANLLADLTQRAARQNIPIKRLPREQLSRITKNRHEDQGIAADLDFNLITPFAAWLEEAPPVARLIALCGLTSPANIGIITRSVAAAGLAGLILTEIGCPKPTLPLVIKASAGNIFRTRLFSVSDPDELLKLVTGTDWFTYSLATEGAPSSLFDHRPPAKAIYMLGNESVGLPKEVLYATGGILSIPLANGVESLNVAAAGTLVAYQVR
ncbi:MAG: RNA methyltransferase [Symbiobacteriaceae bacterium]|nr:RNA methyltransferase [Symbiobacteriaceae bacterium]